MADRENSAAPAREARPLLVRASIEQALDAQPELRELAEAFDREIAADLAAHPAIVLLERNTLHSNAIARLARVTLRVARAAGPKGVRLDLLKRVYQALEVPSGLAERIERKLTVDGVGGVSAGRLYFTGTPESWARLAGTRAE